MDSLVISELLSRVKDIEVPIMNPLLIALFWSLWLLNFSSRLLLSSVLPLVEDQLQLSYGQAGSLFSFIAVGYTLTSVLRGSDSS